nr:TraX family protein [Clostridium peptidivorans]
MKEKGLTGFQLKIIGLLLMIFDHIHEFFNFAGDIPVAFNWVGRIVAPIFIFMTVEGYTHTRSKKSTCLGYIWVQL